MLFLNSFRFTTQFAIKMQQINVEFDFRNCRQSRRTKKQLIHSIASAHKPGLIFNNKNIQHLSGDQPATVCDQINFFESNPSEDDIGMHRYANYNHHL
jgi:hypothetical protein